MRLVVQRVKKAKVGKSEIDKGFLVLIGVGKNDTKEDAKILAEKLSKLRVMADEKGKMNLSVGDVAGQILVISQFTLHGDTKGGNRPSFINAADPENAREIYDTFVEELERLDNKVKTGTFGDYMEIEALLDGPVTILYLD